MSATNRSRQLFIEGLYHNDHGNGLNAVRSFAEAVGYDPYFLDAQLELSKVYSSLDVFSQSRLFDDISPLIEVCCSSEVDHIDILIQAMRRYYHQAEAGIDTFADEIRKALARKCYKRLITALSKPTCSSLDSVEIIDLWRDYQLIRLDTELFQGTYLKMRNPSTGDYHVEGVPPAIKSCRDALMWRTYGIEWHPEQLT